MPSSNPGLSVEIIRFIDANKYFNMKFVNISVENYIYTIKRDFSAKFVKIVMKVPKICISIVVCAHIVTKEPNRNIYFA